MTLRFTQMLRRWPSSMGRALVMGATLLAPVTLGTAALASGDPDGAPAEDPPDTTEPSTTSDDKSPTTTAPDEGEGLKTTEHTEPNAGAVKEEVKPTAAPSSGKPWPIGVRASLTQMVGQSTFVPVGFWNPSVVTQASLTPQLRLYGVTLYMNQTVSFEWTQPDNYSGRRFNMLGDPSVGASYTLMTPWWMAFTVGGGAQAGLSQISRATGVLGGVFGSLSASLITPFGLSLSASSRVQGNAAIPQARNTFGLQTAGKETLNLQSGDVVDVGTCLTRTGDNPLDACAGIPSIGWGSANLSASYRIWRFSFSGSLGAMAFVPAYWGPDDQYTSEHAFVGVYPTMLTSSSLSASLQVWRGWSVSAGTLSFQPLLTLDGKLPRLPLWDFVSPSNNFSNVFVSTSVAF
jgi:hypothetical protein